MNAQSTVDLANNPKDLVKAKNNLMVLTAGISMLYGLGRAIFMCGVVGYCSVISSRKSNGVNFGFLWTIFALHGAFMQALSSYIHVTGINRLWMMLFIALYALSLKNH